MRTPLAGKYHTFWHTASKGETCPAQPAGQISNAACTLATTKMKPLSLAQATHQQEKEKQPKAKD